MARDQVGHPAVTVLVENGQRLSAARHSCQQRWQQVRQPKCPHHKPHDRIIAGISAEQCAPLGRVAGTAVAVTACGNRQVDTEPGTYVLQCTKVVLGSERYTHEVSGCIPARRQHDRRPSPGIRNTKNCSVRASVRFEHASLDELTQCRLERTVAHSIRTRQLLVGGEGSVAGKPS